MPLEAVIYIIAYPLRISIKGTSRSYQKGIKTSNVILAGLVFYNATIDCSREMGQGIERF
jgi:hypothetical protein